MTVRKPFAPTLNSMERATALEARVEELEAAVFELLLAARGLGGSGVVVRSPHAREIALAYQERSRESEVAA